ncbi:MAG: metal-dependent phosphohydrolase [Symploca sp. SIO2G7]|nr:metal-dependent phosphohydrolase [Symploca sp. SIO2G7]
MSNSTKVMISACVEQLQNGYRYVYGSFKPNNAKFIGWAANLILDNLVKGDAPYHNLEHTILVTLAGQRILTGKYILEGSVGISCHDWLNFIISLLCHDVGYVKGVCRQDQVDKNLYSTGIDKEMRTLRADATDASLAPYHIERGKLFVAENFSDHPLLDVKVIQRNIELTRFPVPPEEKYQDTRNFSGLARASDLIGQLSDPHYLQKIPGLFEELKEVGTNKILGYHHPQDLLSGLPNFYHNQVHPYILEALQYLDVTPEGRQMIKSLYANMQQTPQGRHHKLAKLYLGKDATLKRFKKNYKTQVVVGCSN